MMCMFLVLAQQSNILRKRALLRTYLVAYSGKNKILLFFLVCTFLSVIVSMLFCILRKDTCSSGWVPWKHSPWQAARCLCAFKTNFGLSKLRNLESETDLAYGRIILLQTSLTIISVLRLLCSDKILCGLGGKTPLFYSPLIVVVIEELVGRAFLESWHHGVFVGSRCLMCTYVRVMMKHCDLIFLLPHTLKCTVLY